MRKRLAKEIKIPQILQNSSKLTDPGQDRAEFSKNFEAKRKE